MINFTIDIDGINYTQNAVFPLKTIELLDERLDEVELQLIRVKNKKYFNPLSVVTITITNTPNCKIIGEIPNATDYSSDTGYTNVKTNNIITESLTKQFIVANDISIEVLSAKKNNDKFYNHTIYLIELTKVAEGFIGDTITFTNTLGHKYIETT